MAVACWRGLPSGLPELLRAFSSPLRYFWIPLPPQVHFLLHLLFCGSIVVPILLWQPVLHSVHLDDEYDGPYLWRRL